MLTLVKSTYCGFEKGRWIVSLSSDEKNPQTSEASLRKNARLLYVSTSTRGKEWSNVLHTHTNVELFFITGRNGYFRVNTGTFPVEQNDLVIINSDVAHTELAMDGNQFEYLVLGIDEVDFFNQDNKKTDFLRFSCRDDNTELLFYFSQILSEIEVRGIDYLRACHDILDALIIKIIRLTHTSVAVSDQKRSSKRCDLVKQYIDMNFTDQITLDMLAEMAHFSKYHLIHTFSKEVGCSPMNYLNNQRIEESKRLLVTTQRSISEISQLLGFSTQSYFGYCFKKVTNISPVEYRKNAKSLPVEPGHVSIQKDTVL